MINFRFILLCLVSLLLGQPAQAKYRYDSFALNDLNHAVNPILADGFDYLNAKT